MKYVKSIILVVCITALIPMYADQLIDTKLNIDENSSTDIQEAVQKAHTNPIILFTTTNEDNPTGEYWPTPTQITLDLDGKPIDTASAYIGETSYSHVTQTNILQADNESCYFGYFTENNSQKIIYLYGIKDTQIPNDATDEPDDNDTDTEIDATSPDNDNE